MEQKDLHISGQKARHNTSDKMFDTPYRECSVRYTAIPSSIALLLLSKRETNLNLEEDGTAS